MAMSNLNGLEEILTLVRKLSQDNDALRREVEMLSRNNDNRFMILDDEIKLFRSETKSLATKSKRQYDALSNSMRSSQQIHKNAEFTPFLRLPVEIQTIIVKMACYNDPRVVKLHVEHIPSGGHKFCFTGVRTPAILHASPVTRRIILRNDDQWYKKRAVEFGYYDPTFSEVKPEPPKEYFNFDVDILYLTLNEDWFQTFESFEAFGYDWVDVVTKHQTLRDFRRIAIPNQYEFTHFESEWCNWADSLSRPRSKIEDIMIVHGNDDQLEVDQVLVPLMDDDMIPRRNMVDDDDIPGWDMDEEPQYDSVANKLEIISQILALAQPDEVEGYIIKDDPEEEINKAGRARQKAPLKVSYVALKERSPLPESRIFLA